MKRIEPNLLLAASTGLSFLLLIGSAGLFGAAGQWVKYAILALVCTAAFVGLNGWWSRRMGQPQTPMISPDAPGSAAWASLFPAMLMIGAAVPLFFPGRDLGLLVLIGAVWFGVTVQSALRARR